MLVLALIIFVLILGLIFLRYQYRYVVRAYAFCRKVKKMNIFENKKFTFSDQLELFEDLSCFKSELFFYTKAVFNYYFSRILLNQFSVFLNKNIGDKKLLSKTNTALKKALDLSPSEECTNEFLRIVSLKEEFLDQIKNFNSEKVYVLNTFSSFFKELEIPGRFFLNMSEALYLKALSFLRLSKKIDFDIFSYEQRQSVQKLAVGLNI